MFATKWLNHHSTRECKLQGWGLQNTLSRDIWGWNSNYKIPWLCISHLKGSLRTAPSFPNTKTMQPWHENNFKNANGKQMLVVENR